MIDKLALILLTVVFVIAMAYLFGFVAGFALDAFNLGWQVSQ